MLMVYEGKVFISPEERYQIQSILGDNLPLPGSESQEDWIRWIEQTKKVLERELEDATEDGIVGMEAAMVCVKSGTLEYLKDMLTGKL